MQGATVNFTQNVLFNNTGLHTIDVSGTPRVLSEWQTFLWNYLYENIALGHGYQYEGTYGYLPDDGGVRDGLRGGKRRLKRRRKRQIGSVSGREGRRRRTTTVVVMVVV